MNIINIIILVVVGFAAAGFGYWLGRKKPLNQIKVKDKGLIERQADEKRQNIEAILGLMESGNQPLTNNHVEQMLGIPESTVTRYFDELEREGRVRQVGATGRDVYYELR
jgi:Fic family protein